MPTALSLRDQIGTEGDPAPRLTLLNAESQDGDIDEVQQVVTPVDLALGLLRRNAIVHAEQIGVGTICLSELRKFVIDPHLGDPTMQEAEAALIAFMDCLNHLFTSEDRGAIPSLDAWFPVAREIYLRASETFTALPKLEDFNQHRALLTQIKDQIGNFLASSTTGSNLSTMVVGNRGIFTERGSGKLIRGTISTIPAGEIGIAPGAEVSVDNGSTWESLYPPEVPADALWEHLMVEHQIHVNCEEQVRPFEV